MKRQLWFTFMGAVVIALLGLLPGHGWSGTAISVPKPFAVIDHVPLKVVVHLSRGTDPESFRAWMNDKDITAAFHRENNKMIGEVGLQDGLRISVDSDSDGFSFAGLNFLKVQAQTIYHRKITTDHRIFFVQFTGDTAYSGVYCIDLLDFEMTIYRSDDQVAFILTINPEYIIEGTGTVSGNRMTLQAQDPENGRVTLQLEFSADGNSFIGSYFLEQDGEVEEGAFNGQRGICEPYGPPGDITMITPYVDPVSVSAITGGFSTTTDCPWGMLHDGIDIAPAHDLMPFQAVADGKVTAVEKFLNDGNGYWQVNVNIKYNSDFNVSYGFEPMSPLEIYGNQQLALIEEYIYEGKEVIRGEIIGKLLSSQSDAAHVHFALRRYDESICPEPYFTSDARESLLKLLHIWWPAADRLCYE